MPAPDSILKLCDTFATHLDHYKSSGYNETEVRREFLDPLFTALGWDVDNKQGYADAYKDVIHEDAIKIGGYTKAPDYCFRIGGTRKFFLEAKKPSVDIKGDIAPAFQLRRYAWSAKLPLSILSDFEELSVYDCRMRPNQKDKSSTARISYITYQEYPERWEEIESVFSREAVLRGSFDQYAESSKKKRGTAEVDDSFLAEIERWRDVLARNFALRNPQLTVRDLNYAVQKTIDRLIFLRICEDRGTEDYGRLNQLVNGENTWGRLREQFSRADDRYNSGLFHFSDEKGRPGAPDTLTPSLTLDDKVIKDIVKHLYYPDSPFEFSVFPADVLGQVYEQFLGKTIRLTASHQAKIEEKPEVRKAGGVYYTPKYIVDYIVENTLGRLLNGTDPENPKPISTSKAAKLKVCDPACGSGSFLIVAYQYLLDWHRDQYTLDPATREPDEAKATKNAKGKAPKIYQTPSREGGGEWKLTTTERKRILLNNIHGVDIDSQAVEVTKLSLLLKVLEGETQQQLQRDFLKERQRILPDLGNNIQCGNSLIGPDFYDQPDLPELDDETRYRINVFDWKQAFPEVFEQGGFDCVVGNPPYLAGRNWTANLKQQRSYFKTKYTELTDQYDLYALFIEKGVAITRTNGMFGYITPNTWLNNQHYISLRKWTSAHCLPTIIGDFRNVKVFADATVLPIVYVGAKQKKVDLQAPIRIDHYSSPTELTHSVSNLEIWQHYEGSIFNLDMSKQDMPVIEKIAEQVRLEEIAACRFGVKVYQKGKGKPKQTGEEAKSKLFESPTKDSETHLPYIRGKNVNSWVIDDCLNWLNYGTHLAEPRSIELFTDPRIILRRIVGDRLILTPISEVAVADQLLHTVKLTDPSEPFRDNLYLAALLGSKLMSYYFKKRYNRTERTFPEIRVSELKSLPIRTIDFTNPTDVEKHDRMVTLVERMLSLHEKKADEKNPETLRHLESDITRTDRQIDRLVYDLYGLTDEEIAIVEG